MKRFFLMLFLLALVGGQVIRAETPKDPLQKYHSFLGSLDKEDPSSVQKATDEFARSIADLDTASRDKAFVNFLIFYSQVCDAIEGRLNVEFSSKLDKLTESERDNVDWGELFCPSALKETLKANGLRPVPDAYDSPRVDQDPEYAPAHFGGFVSPSLRTYLELRKSELDGAWCEDAAIGITREELAARVRKWEQYTIDYPESPLLKDAQELFKDYFPSFLKGQDNTRVFEYTPVPNQASSGPEQAIYKASQEDIALFRNYAKANPTTFSGRKVAEFLSLLEKSGYEETPDISSFLVKTEEEMERKFLGSEATCYFHSLLFKVVY